LKLSSFPPLLDFFVIVAKGASSSLSLLNYCCWLPKDLELLFKKMEHCQRR
jgi:hypothetical protein